MATKPPGRPRTDSDIVAAIEALAITQMRPAEIYRKLKDDKRFVGRFPQDKRTVERIVQRLQPRDLSAPWSFFDHSGDDARIILDALAAVIYQSEGRVKALTQVEAELVVKIWHVAPDINPFQLWRLARMYL